MIIIFVILSLALCLLTLWECYRLHTQFGRKPEKSVVAAMLIAVALLTLTSVVAIKG